jgi:protoheme IX farnesyltransferase
MFRDYFYLTKPGIIIGNLITATGAFLFAAAGGVDGGLMLATLAGIALVIASACVANNYIDRDIDARMERTRWRALASGKIKTWQALAFAGSLGYAGFLLLAAFTNTLTLWLGVLAFLDYVVFYGIAKRRSPWGTLVGTVAGALPAVAGYTAVTGQMDGAAWTILAILTFWQMPHFYAIAIYRLDDYRAAGLPVWPAKYGIESTKANILGFIIIFAGVAALLTVLGYASAIYLAGMMAASAVWLRLAHSYQDDKSWARSMFKFSLIVILAFSFLISLEGWI